MHNKNVTLIPLAVHTAQRGVDEVPKTNMKWKLCYFYCDVCAFPVKTIFREGEEREKTSSTPV